MPKTGARAPSFCAVVPSRMVSSALTLLPSAVTIAVISSPKAPFARARAASSCDRALYSSSSARESDHLSATSSALTPCGTRSGNRARTPGPYGSAP